MTSCLQTIENESVPIQLAQCWFPGLAISNAEIQINFFRIEYTEAVLSNSTRKLLWFEITKMLIAILNNKFVVLFVIIFSTLLFPITRNRRCEKRRIVEVTRQVAVRIRHCGVYSNSPPRAAADRGRNLMSTIALFVHVLASYCRPNRDPYRTLNS